MLYKKYLRYMLLALSLGLMGCPQEGTVTEGSTTGDFSPPPPAEETVCEPFDGEGQPGLSNHGVKGLLYYKGTDQPNFTNVNQYFEEGYLIPNLVLYLNKLHIPTRPFDRGFITQNGEQILTPEGNDLYEWFAVKYNGQFTLAPNQAPGFYEMTVLADDGATLLVDDGAGMEMLVDNDGTHSTKMGCATRPIYLDGETPVPFELNYNQGPRYHIALVVMMRPWVDNNVDPSCNLSGNNRYFDSTQDPPTPNAGYLGLLSRGWTPLEVENYLMPEAQGTNPCNQVAPIISGFMIVGMSQTTVRVAWNTDIFATSQVQVTNAATGQQLLTAKDMNFVQAHNVLAAGLSPNTLYKVRAISESSSGLSTTSVEILFRTSR